MCHYKPILTGIFFTPWPFLMLNIMLTSLAVFAAEALVYILLVLHTHLLLGRLVQVEAELSCSSAHQGQSQHEKKSLVRQIPTGQFMCLPYFNWK